MKEQLGVCSSIISDLLEVARESTPRCDPIDLTAVVSEVVGTLTVPASVRVELAVEEGLHLLGDHGLLRQALVNLVGNSIIALRKRGGVVCIVAHVEGDETVLEVSDDGPGFPPDILHEVFEPLVTTRPKGTGLGLALVESVARRHGGMATAGNRPEGGAQVSLRLPRSGPPQHPIAP